MKSSEALKAARKLIANGEEEYVCFALTAVGGGKTVVRDNIDSVCDGGSIRFWLADESADFAAFLHKHKYHYYSGPVQEALQQYRLRWLNWLIPQYEAVGD